MSGLSDHESEAPEAIERHLTAQDQRLAYRLAYPGWFIRWRWGTHREYLTALLVLAGLSLLPIITALTQ